MVVDCLRGCTGSALPPHPLHIHPPPRDNAPPIPEGNRHQMTVPPTPRGGIDTTQQSPEF